MSFYKLANFAISELASGITDSATTLIVKTGEGALFPSAGDFMLVVAVGATDTSEESNIEIVKCTGRSTDTLTIVRAQEGTSAVAHAAGELVALRVTKGVLEEVQDAVDARLKAPTGSVEWKDRTYVGWELVTTAATYTVGSGGDFATLAAAAASLQGLVLVADLTVQLLEKVTLTADVSFKGMISAGGKFQIDLAGYDLEISDGCSGGLYIYGNMQARIYKSTGTSSLKMVATSIDPPYYMVNAFEGCILRLDAIIVDANSKANYSSARAFKGMIEGRNVTWSNEANLTRGGVVASSMGRAGFETSEPAVLGAEQGGIGVKIDGTVVTTLPT